MDSAGAVSLQEPGGGSQSCRWLLTGRVQGVGFRPFVYRLAQAYGIRGYVHNVAGQVVIVGEAGAAALAQFSHALLAQAPPLALPRIASCASCAPAGYADFRIVPSEHARERDLHLPPDCFCCDDCLRELGDPADRRYRYPFINCTQCGPRYTLITGMPYDRENTTMREFAMCPLCRAEYEDPGNRRFHAEPIACPACGPQLCFHAPGPPAIDDTQAALAACAAQLAAGRIVAVKGIGGYHLMADATSESTVARLRERKRRPHKPLALMLPAGAARIRALLDLDEAGYAALAGPLRPILLARPRAGGPLAPNIAPGLHEVGAMLAYSPLHHLLIEAAGVPLVATSANLSGEPVLTEAHEVEARLAGVADCYLHHGRRIARPADDPVFRMIAGRPRPMRMGRGAAPIDLALPFPLPGPVLAAGSQMKNTLALGWGARAAMSPHIGDLDSARAMDVFQQTAADMAALHGVSPAAIACDAHPGFASTRWATGTGLPLIKVWHHHAHASALAAEHPDVDAWLVFTWDGVGLGADGTLWGGEAFAGAPGHWRRVATLRSLRIVGAGLAARELWRSAAAMCWDAGQAWRLERYALLQHAWRRQLNCHTSSAAGRLFDGAAVLLGLLEEGDFEGQGPMWLEAAADGNKGAALPLPVARNATGLWELDWRPMLPILLDASRPSGERAAIFQASLASGLLAQAHALRRETGVRRVGLCGGVFQNRWLTGQVAGLLAGDGFDVRLAERLPCNDAALSFGQLVEAGARS